MSVMSSNIPSWHTTKIGCHESSRSGLGQTKEARKVDAHQGGFHHLQMYRMMQSPSRIYQSECGFEKDDSPKFQQLGSARIKLH